MSVSKLQFLRSALRRASMRWGPIWKTRNAARRPYTGPNKRQKYEYQCSDCKKWFPSGKVQVDHIVPVGALKTMEDLVGFVERLLCDETGLRVLCLACHRKVTKSSPRSSSTTLAIGPR